MSSESVSVLLEEFKLIAHEMNRTYIHLHDEDDRHVIEADLKRIHHLSRRLPPGDFSPQTQLMEVWCMRWSRSLHLLHSEATCLYDDYDRVLSEYLELVYVAKSIAHTNDGLARIAACLQQMSVLIVKGTMREVMEFCRRDLLSQL